MAFPKKVWEPRIEGGLTYIPLSQGLEAVVDLVDLPLVRDFAWCAVVDGSTFYAKTSVREAGGSWAVLSMHRLILGLRPGESGPDHANGDGWDNRRINLRLATSQQNSHNRRPKQGCSSQYKGVAWHRKNAKWVVRIYCDGKKYFLGYYTDEVEAARAYDEAACEHFGEFAYLNFP